MKISVREYRCGVRKLRNPYYRRFSTSYCIQPHTRRLNVTIPYKEKVIPYLNELAPDAAAIGAVNVIKFERNKGKLN